MKFDSDENRRSAKPQIHSAAKPHTHPQLVAGSFCGCFLSWHMRGRLRAPRLAAKPHAYAPIAIQPRAVNQKPKALRQSSRWTLAINLLIFPRGSVDEPKTRIGSAVGLVGGEWLKHVGFSAIRPDLLAALASHCKLSSATPCIPSFLSRTFIHPKRLRRKSLLYDHILLTLALTSTPARQPAAYIFIFAQPYVTCVLVVIHS